MSYQYNVARELTSVCTFCIVKYVYDVAVKRSRSLSHLLMSFLYICALKHYRERQQKHLDVFIIQ